MIVQSGDNMNSYSRKKNTLFAMHRFAWVQLWNVTKNIQWDHSFFEVAVELIQVNLCQKLLFLHQLIHNITTDCSLLMKIVSSEYMQNMLCTQIVVFVLFWHSEQFLYTACSNPCSAKKKSFWHRFTCTFNNLRLSNRLSSLKS